MKRKHYKVIISTIFIILIISISLLNNKTDYNKINFDNVVNNINKNNKLFKTPVVNIENYVNSIDNNDYFSNEYIDNLSSKNSSNSSLLSKSQAIEDIYFFFELLRKNYGLYTYFGGDTIFLKAKNNVINYIMTKNTITKKEFYDVLIKNLNFINDNHFIINYDKNTYKILCKNFYFFTLDEEYYYKDYIGFFTNSKSGKKYILKINDNSEVDSYMKLSISNSGELVYKIGKLINFDNNESNITNSNSFEINVEYKLANKTISEKKQLTKANNLLNSNVPFSFNINDNIPILSLRSLTLNEQTKNKFLQSAFKCQKYKINILDLRGNIGGDGSLVVQWLENRFESRPVGNSKKIGLNRFLIDGKLPSIEGTSISNLYNLEVKKDYFFSNDIDDAELYENDSIIFVLTDKNQGSAGEMFIEYLKNYENVILIGSNTSGTLQGSNCGINFKLPNSAISFQLGQWLFLFDDNYFKEGIGFKPDIWTNGSDALELVLKLIDYYDLN